MMLGGERKTCAGATFLPAKDAQDARKTVSKVMAGGLNATEAIARGFGLKSHVEQRTEREAALKVCPAVSCMHLLVCRKPRHLATMTHMLYMNAVQQSRFSNPISSTVSIPPSAKSYCYELWADIGLQSVGGSAKGW